MDEWKDGWMDGWMEEEGGLGKETGLLYRVLRLTE